MRLFAMLIFARHLYEFFLVFAYLFCPLSPFVFPPLPILQSKQVVLASFGEKTLGRNEKTAIYEHAVQKKDTGDLHERA